MRAFIYAKRVTKEIVRDPLTLFFGLGFPIVLLLLLSAIQANIPVEMFVISKLTPGILIFGMSFITLFSALLISKDRSSAFLLRLYTTPLTPLDFLVGYMLPMIPISLAQALLCIIVALFLGLKISVDILIALIFIIPISLFFTSVGLLIGSLLNEKQVGGICGALFTNLCAFLSGIWFDLGLVGGVFKKIAYCLPFVHAVDMEKALFAGDIAGIFPHILWVIGYTAIFGILAVIVFLRQMKKA